MRKLFLALALSLAFVSPAVAHEHRHFDYWRDTHHAHGHYGYGDMFWDNYFLHGGLIPDPDVYWRHNYDPYHDGYELGPDEEFIPNGRCVENSRIDEDGNEVRWLRCYR